MDRSECLVRLKLAMLVLIASPYSLVQFLRILQNSAITFDGDNCWSLEPIFCIWVLKVLIVLIAW